ncbi:putative anti-sigma-YlaC factor YlaD [Hamadaea flava]|uniref:Anti-sigma-YlaC factor YlaD n=1 Tax=Hamadaea flava TaxID=1742688 RepID=A0ABV8LH72_9ACTN|nr:hypothetical protein [Hamadaea flava]MCP2324355.1 putative anti-sigma-YlaC factor YlaD [Hamadaea flava]
MGVAPACEFTRDNLSASMDGDVRPSAEADRHLAGCAECSAWWERVQQLDRLTRTAISLPTPGLTEDALAAVIAAAPKPSPSPSRLPSLLRLALLAVGLAQFLLGVAQISSLAAGGSHSHDPVVAAVSSGHLWHESAAWNVAIGAALAWLAWRRTRPGGLLPVMTAFVAVLTLLTVNDAVIGRVEVSRILSHGFVLAGYALLLMLNRRGFGEPPADRKPKPWRLGGPADEVAEDGPLATVHPLPVRMAYRQQVTVQQRHAA